MGKDDFNNIVLPANKLDIFHGTFGDEGQRERKNIFSLLDSVNYNYVEGIEVEVNTVRCQHLSAMGFLRNNDTNVTS